MRIRTGRWWWTWMVLGTSVLGMLLTDAPDATAAGKMDAVRGKRYKLTERHGPWMIMVAAFREPPPEVRQKEGMTPEEAADELVYELRKVGIPAYTFSQDDVTDKVDTFDRVGRVQQRAYYAQQGSICVLAGNYGSPDDRLAQDTLNWIKKKFDPEFLSGKNVEKGLKLPDGTLQKLKNGGIFRITPGQPGPLSGAFLTINPVLSPEEAARRQRDPLLVQLNSGMDYSLLDNPGRYTLVVASSYVKTTTATDESSFRKKLEAFTVSNNLDESALSAWQLAKTLREGRVPVQNQNLGVGQRNFEAYVFHDRYRSIVTVGSFDSPNDPRIREYKEMFGAKMRTNPQTGQKVLIAEVMTLPDVSGNGGSLKSWIFDPEPQLIEVPRFAR